MKPSPAPEAPLRVFYIGRLSPEKGVDILLRAWALLQNSPSRKSVETQESEQRVAFAGAFKGTSSLFPRPSSLTIVGDGPERPALDSLATTLGIANRVEFTGALSRSSARAALASASLLVLPSICYEQFSTTVLEAMQVGIPTLVSDVARVGTILKDGVTGRFFTAGDPVALAAALRELLAAPALLRRMGSAARAAFEASDCVPARNLARLERVYAPCATPR